MLRRQSLPELAVLGLIAAGFVASTLLYRALFPDSFDYLTSDEVTLGFLTCVGTFWFAVKLVDEDIRNPWMRFLDEFRLATGINLIIQALLNYLDILTRSLFLIAVGSLFAATLLAIARRFTSFKGGGRSGSLLVGFDRSAAELIRQIPQPLLGVVGDNGPAGVPTMGYRDLSTVLAARHPSVVVITPQAAGQVDTALLLQERLSGARVQTTRELYERLFGRIDCRGREPADLALSPKLSGNAQAMALQSIYTNLIGLTLLVLLAPVIAATATAVLLFSGPGPVMTHAEYSGFRNIPFRRLRFRTRKADGTGAYTSIGRLIERCRLANLPLLFNVVRGEMALFGPPAVQREFVTRLTRLMPFYGMRLAVKPGIVGWVGMWDNDPVHGDVLQDIESDLYYVKHASPALDFEILLRLLFGRARSGESRAELATAAR